jgi:hypothetical protein
MPLPAHDSVSAKTSATRLPAGRAPFDVVPLNRCARESAWIGFTPTTPPKSKFKVSYEVF